jgi:hypothetical protein
MYIWPLTVETCRHGSPIQLKQAQSRRVGAYYLCRRYREGVHARVDVVAADDQILALQQKKNIYTVVSDEHVCSHAGLAVSPTIQRHSHSSAESES